MAVLSRLYKFYLNRLYKCYQNRLYKCYLTTGGGTEYNCEVPTARLG